MLAYIPPSEKKPPRCKYIWFHETRDGLRPHLDFYICRLSRNEYPIHVPFFTIQQITKLPQVNHTTHLKVNHKLQLSGSITGVISIFVTYLPVNPTQYSTIQIYDGKGSLQLKQAGGLQSGRCNRISPASHGPLLFHCIHCHFSSKGGSDLERGWERDKNITTRSVWKYEKPNELSSSHFFPPSAEYWNLGCCHSSALGSRNSERGLQIRRFASPYACYLVTASAIRLLHFVISITGTR